MKTTVTVLAAIMLAIGSAQLVKAQPSSDPMVKEKGMMDKGAMDDMEKGMMDHAGMAAGNMLDDTMMDEGGEDWSLEEEGAMDKAMGKGMEYNKSK